MQQLAVVVASMSGVCLLLDTAWRSRSLRNIYRHVINLFSYLLITADPNISAGGHHVKNVVLNKTHSIGTKLNI